jgi:hypothetical protein
MEAPGDKMAATHAEPSTAATRKPAPKPGKNGKPVAMARFGSASVPVYRCGSAGRVRFAICHYRELTTEEQADKWFSIVPKEGQWENTVDYDTRTRTVNLAAGNGGKPRSIRAPRKRKSA